MHPDVPDVAHAARQTDAGSSFRAGVRQGMAGAWKLWATGQQQRHANFRRTSKCAGLELLALGNCLTGNYTTRPDTSSGHVMTRVIFPPNATCNRVFQG
jgi:hypothetical protein